MAVPTVIPGCVACLTSELEVLKVIAAEAGEDLGENGAQIFTDTADHTGSWRIITADQDTTFTKLRSTNINLNELTNGILDGFTLLKGISLYGAITEIQIAASNPAGVVTAYK
jgi:hypothetical protein